jgi:hypothetical protein
MIPVTLATEDELSEAAGMKLLAEHPELARITPQLLRKNGSGYLRSRMESWRQMATRQLVIVLTDLDSRECPLVLLEDWFGADRQCPQNLLLRIAVREIESWLLADHDAFEKLIGKKGRLPADPDKLPDPKRHLLKLAHNAPRTVKDDLLPRKGAIAIQGIGYNRRLVEWVMAEWSPARAARRSPSLLRARTAIREATDRTIRFR